MQTAACRIFSKGEVLSSRQLTCRLYPRDYVPVFFAFGSDRKRIRPLRLVQPSRLVLITSTGR